ncbi:uncharacterized protein [Eucyclogobius newberryi]|uniref:uncharacterized protein n=1 Tax=Eucyclogobius newberryi TaxID=166745 RepID=UPI003B5B53DE
MANGVSSSVQCQSDLWRHRLPVSLLNMWFPKCVIFIWSFYALTQGSDAFTCHKGQMVVKSKKGVNRCDSCPKNTFQSKETTSQYCEPCRKCADSMGSETLEACTAERNTKCKCREHFVPLENDSSTCECANGFTIRFRECVKEEEKSQTKVTASIKPHHLLTTLTSPRPQERAPSPTPSPKPAHKPTTIATSHPAIKIISRLPDLFIFFAVVGPIFLIVTLLILTALICKLKLFQRMKRRPEQTRDPSFRIPVEESGNGSQDSLKENQEEL